MKRRRIHQDEVAAHAGEHQSVVSRTIARQRVVPERASRVWASLQVLIDTYPVRA